MGEGIMVVAIKGTAYIIKSGHYNSDQKAIEMALEKHKQNIIDENKYCREHNITDEHNNPVFADSSINEILVFTGELTN